MKKIITIYNSIPKYIKTSIIRFFFSFFFAWLVSALIMDFPNIAKYVKQTGINIAERNLLLFLSKTQLEAIGFEPIIENNKLFITESKYGIIYYGCLSIRNVSMFITFVVLYYGKLLKKLFFIIIGSCLLIIINSLRITILAITLNGSSQYLQTVHDTITPIMMTGTMLVLIFYWTNKQLKKHKLQQDL